MQELSDVWRSTATDAVNISGDFSPRDFAAALHYLKPGKAPGPDSICPELLIHACPAWSSGYLASLFPACANSRFQTSGEEHW